MQRHLSMLPGKNEIQRTYHTLKGVDHSFQVLRCDTVTVLEDIIDFNKLTVPADCVTGDVSDHNYEYENSHRIGEVNAGRTRTSRSPQKNKSP